MAEVHIEEEQPFSSLLDARFSEISQEVWLAGVGDHSIAFVTGPQSRMFFMVCLSLYLP